MARAMASDARTLKTCGQSNCRRDHVAHLRSAELELVVVRGGKRGYVWVGQPLLSGRCYGVLEGPTALRAFAKAILAEVGEGPTEPEGDGSNG